MNYELGLHTLKTRLPADALGEFHFLEARLRENLDQERLYGSTETIRADRAAIVYGLNRLAQTHCGVSFNELCSGASVSAATPAPPPAGASTPAQSTTYHIHIEQASGIAIGDGAQVVSASAQPGPTPQPATRTRSAPPSDLPALRPWLNQQFDDAELDAFCLDHFPEIYDKFTRGLQKGEKITLLLDYCRRESDRWEALLAALESQSA